MAQRLWPIDPSAAAVQMLRWCSGTGGRMVLWFVVLFGGTYAAALCCLALGAELAGTELGGAELAGTLAVSARSSGAALYESGLLRDGSAVQGVRATSGTLRGQAAACITCHRASGLGSTEGRVAVPPITGKYLFKPHSTNVIDVRLPNPSGVRVTRGAYTAESFARAVREGVAPDGRTLSVLMPRYALDDAALADVLNYLTPLGAKPAPGVSEDTLHFATIITPDSNPVQRQAMLAVLERFFADKNAFVRGGQRAMVSNRGVEYRVVRRWQLHVWNLQGPPQGWEQQLQAQLRAQPVLAVVSGLGGANWDPVHRFCQSAHLPCLLPNVDLPIDAEQDFYAVYFSRGVLLEAALMHTQLKQWLQDADAARVVQVYRPGTVGEAAALALEKVQRVQSRALASEDPAALAQALQGIGPHDVLVLWLSDADLAALPAQPPTARVLVSGLLGRLEQAHLAAAWKAVAHMTYPVDLPEQRRVRMNFPLAWMRIHQLEVVDERLQTDTYVACGILAETLTELQDSLEPDYLLERLEGMLSHRQVNGYYPRLSLGPGQRFASKGGYVVRWDGSAGQRVVAESDWLVP